MRVLFVITGLGVGGAERQVVNLADRFAGKGWQVMIAYLTGDARLTPESPSIRIAGIGISKSPAGLVQAYASLRRLIIGFKPDIVHSHMVHANIIARLIRLTTNIPYLICTAHSTNEGGAIRMLTYRLTDSLADVTTNVSDEAVAAFEKKGAFRAGRMQAVANGIDTDRFCHTQDLREKLRVSEDLKPKDKVVLSVGSLTGVKDYPNLLKAFAEVCQSTNKAVQLWIAGEGCLLFELQELAAQLSVAGRVRFLGVRHDIPDLMNVADVFVLPSALEGFGIVVAEAMACQKVVVATNCGGVGEVLGDCGFLVPPQDSHALAEAMAQALALTAEDATSMGVRARQRVVDKYSLDRVVEIWVDLYREKELYK